MWLVCGFGFELNFLFVIATVTAAHNRQHNQMSYFRTPLPSEFKKKKKELANQWPHTVPTAAASGRPVSRGPGMRSLLASKAT